MEITSTNQTISSNMEHFSGLEHLQNKQYTYKENLEKILKTVQRDRRKVLEDKEWYNFLARRADKSTTLLDERQVPQQDPNPSTFEACQPEQSIQMQLEQNDDLIPTKEMNPTFQTVSLVDEVNFSESIQRHLSPIDEEPLAAPASSHRGHDSPETCHFPSPQFSCPDSFQQPISMLKSSVVSLDSTIDFIPKNSNPARLINERQVRRINEFCKKIATTLDKITFQRKNLLSLDDSEDYARCCKRATGFTAMFGRNYLYPLKMKVQDIRMYNGLALSTKFVDACQHVTNALVSFLSHISSLVMVGVVDKLRELLHYVIQLCQLSCRLDITFDDPAGSETSHFQDIDKKCKDILAELDSERQRKNKPGNQLAGKGIKEPPKIKKAVPKKKSPYLIPMAASRQRVLVRRPKQQKKQHEGNTLIPIAGVDNDPVSKISDIDERKPIITDMYDDENVDTMMQHISMDDLRNDSKAIHADSVDRNCSLLSEILKTIEQSKESAPLKKMKQMIETWEQTLVAKTTAMRSSFISQESQKNCAKNAQLIYVQSQTPAQDVECDQSLSSKSRIDSCYEKNNSTANSSSSVAETCEDNAQSQDTSLLPIIDQNKSYTNVLCQTDVTLVTGDIDTTEPPQDQQRSSPVRDIPDIINQLSDQLVADVFIDEMEFIDTLVSMMFKLEFQ